MQWYPLSYRWWKYPLKNLERGEVPLWKRENWEPCRVKHNTSNQKQGVCINMISIRVMVTETHVIILKTCWASTQPTNLPWLFTVTYFINNNTITIQSHVQSISIYFEVLSSSCNFIKCIYRQCYVGVTQSDHIIIYVFYTATVFWRVHKMEGFPQEISM